MCRIPYVRRRDGRYMFRRRVHFRNLISKPLPVALRTADPGVARRRAALLSARFMLVKVDVDAMLESGRALTGAEIEAIFRQRLEEELSFYVQSAYENASWSSSVMEVAAQEAEAYRILCLPDRHRGMTEADRTGLIERGLEAEIDAIVDYMRQARDGLDDKVVACRLAAIGAPAHDQNIAAARGHMIRAGAAACARILHHLAPAGTAGVILANGSMSSTQNGEGEIRRAMVEGDVIDCMIAMPGQLFYSTQIPVCIWFLARDKSNGVARNARLRDRRGEILFIDARKLGHMVDRTRRAFLRQGHRGSPAPSMPGARTMAMPTFPASPAPPATRPSPVMAMS